MINTRQPYPLYGKIVVEHLYRNPQNFIASNFAYRTYTLSELKRDIERFRMHMISPEFVRAGFENYCRDTATNYVMWAQERMASTVKFPGISEEMVFCNPFYLAPGSVFSSRDFPQAGFEINQDYIIPGYITAVLATQRRAWRRLIAPTLRGRIDFRMNREGRVDIYRTYTARAEDLSGLYLEGLVKTVNIIEQANHALLGRGNARPRWIR